MKKNNNERPSRDWVVGTSDTGQAVLEWRIAGRAARRPEADPCARTYDFLDQLDAPELTLADDAGVLSPTKGLNPYDTGRLLVKAKVLD